MKLYHLDATSCSFNGETFDRQEDGSFEVPDEAQAELAAHGFATVLPEEEDDSPKKKGKKG